MRGYDAQSTARRWWQWQHAITANGCWQASAQLFQSVTFSESGWDRGSPASSSFWFPNHSVLLHSVATTALYPKILLVHIFISSHLHQSHSFFDLYPQCFPLFFLCFLFLSFSFNFSFSAASAISSSWLFHNPSSACTPVCVPLFAPESSLSVSILSHLSFPVKFPINEILVYKPSFYVHFMPPLLQSYHCLTISLSLFYACLLNAKSQQPAVDTSTCSACCSCQALQAEREGQTHQHTPHSGGTLWEVLWPGGAVHERNSKYSRWQRYALTIYSIYQSHFCYSLVAAVSIPYLG